MTTYFNTITSHVDKGTTLLVKLWTPQKGWITVAAAAAWWYGRQVALTYAPSLVADYFIDKTAAYLGSATLGKVIGATIVAPAMTPSIVPWVAVAAGFGFFILTVIICNIALFIFRYCRGTPIIQPEPAKA